MSSDVVNFDVKYLTNKIDVFNIQMVEEKKITHHLQKMIKQIELDPMLH